jgi:hypothetical protein
LNYDTSFEREISHNHENPVEIDVVGGGEGDDDYVTPYYLELKGFC